jgi:hypothetical protein
MREVRNDLQSVTRVVVTRNSRLGSRSPSHLSWYPPTISDRPTNQPLLTADNSACVTPPKKHTRVTFFLPTALSCACGAAVGAVGWFKIVRGTPRGLSRSSALAVSMAGPGKVCNSDCTMRIDSGAYPVKQ